MATIASLVAKTQARHQQQARTATQNEPNDIANEHVITTAHLPSAPGAPPQDLPQANPQRGSLPASLINVSDLNDSQRQFRSGPVRSAIFPYPAPILGSGSDKIAQIQAQVAANQTETATATAQLAETSAKLDALNMDTIPEGVNFGKTVQVAMTPLGSVNPALPGVVTQGSIPPSLSTPFKITVANTSVTINTSPSCFFTRADGTRVLIGQTSMACTGLPTGNQTFFFPYWDEPSQSLQWVKGSDITIPSITGVLFAAASSQYIETTTGASIPTAFTLEMWIKGTAAGALADFSAPQVGGSTTASIMQLQATSAGEIEFSVHDSGSWASVTTSGASVLDGCWHHIMVTFGAASGSIYVDGANTSDDVTFWTNGSMGTPLTTTGYWHFGFIGGLAGAPITSNLYNSFTLSHIALYDAALTSIQAAAHMQAFANLGESYWIAETAYDSAVNEWLLTETSGTTAADSVGTNTGTYKASPTLNQTSLIVTILGSPADAFPYNYVGAIQAQQLRSRTPLSSGGIGGTTGTNGSQSGGGSGGGGGTGGRGGGYCFTAGTLIKTQRGNVRIADIVAGDLCLTAKGTWLPVAKLIKHEAERLCLHVMSDNELVTFKHKVLRDREWVNAGLVFTETREVNEPVYTISMDSEEPESEMMSPTTERSFTLANGVISHNNTIIK